jgi:CHAT domain-containing protein
MASVALCGPRIQGVVLSSLLIASLLTTFGCHHERAPGGGVDTGARAKSEADGSGTTQPPEPDGRLPLGLGEVAAANLAGDSARAYLLDLAAGQRVRLRIDKGDLSLQVSFCAPEGGGCAEFPSRRFGPLDVPLTAAVGGTYKLEVRALESDPTERAYRLEVSGARSAPESHAQGVLAAQASAEAERLRALWEERALREAVERYGEAARHWKAAGEAVNAAAALSCAGDVHYVLSEYPQALDFYERALRLSEAAGDRGGAAAALNGIGYVYLYLGDKQKARGFTKRVLAEAARARGAAVGAGRLRVEARALNNLGEVYYSLGELRESVGLFERALGVWAEAGGDRRGESLAHLNIGYSLSDLGELRGAAEHYRRSLSLWQSVDDRRGVALAQTALGGVYSFFGEKETALDLHRQAVGLFRALGNRQGEAAALNGIAHVYEDLNEPLSALDNYSQALRLYEHIGNRDFAALNKLYVGRMHYLLGDTGRALDNYHQSLALSREVGDREIEAHALNGVGLMYDAGGEKARALGQFEFVLTLYRRIGNRRGQAYALNNLGYVYSSLGERQKALACFRQALPLIRAAGDRRGEALTLLNNARAERDGGNNEAAMALVKESIHIIELQRTKVKGADLRTSYFASVHEHYELYIDLLMTLDAEHPGAGYAAEALLASERARARSLMESLAGERTERQGGADAALLRREREVQEQLDSKAEYRMRLLSGKHTVEQEREVARELRALALEYQEIRAIIRENSPRVAALTQPESLGVEQILREVREDGDTLLLEFSLGEERSYLWVVSAAGIESHVLPARATIEKAVSKTYELLTKRQTVEGLPSGRREEVTRAADAEYRKESAALSRMLLGPAAARLAARRLLIVSDGILQHIPFEALPEPTGAGEPLLLGHEIIGLPSALILSALRQEKGQDAPRTIAVLADPVFDKDDPRVSSPGTGAAAHTAGGDVYLSRALRNVAGVEMGAFSIPRLPSTRREARAIEALLPSGEAMIATDFAASRSQVLGEELSRYRIVHFATHGILDSEHPELSGIILSLVDERGNPQNGFLRLHDIYKLDLAADLVVLSACRTGLGRNIRGEGVMGLTRGFLYAGSKSVVASLWQVDDEATSELMGHFYRGLLKDGLTPAAALRAAKIEMLKRDDRRPPYFWAAFVLQGEYRERFAAGGGRGNAVYVIAALLLSAAGLYPLRNALRGRRRV